jgi:hypothetical protein
MIGKDPDKTRCFSFMGAQLVMVYSNGVFKLPLQTWYLARSLDNLFNTLTPLLSNSTRQLFSRPILAVAADSTFGDNPFLASGRADLAYFLKYIEADSTIPKTDLQVYEHCVDTILNLYAVLAPPTPAQQHIPYELIFLTPIWEPPRFLDMLSQGIAPALALLARAWCLLKSVSGLWWSSEATSDDMAKYNLHGIQAMLPMEWAWSMDWPLRVLNGELRQKSDLIMLRAGVGYETG